MLSVNTKHLWGPNGLIMNQCTQKNSQMYLGISLFTKYLFSAHTNISFIYCIDKNNQHRNERSHMYIWQICLKLNYTNVSISRNFHQKTHMLWHSYTIFWMCICKLLVVCKLHGISLWDFTFPHSIWKCEISN